LPHWRLLLDKTVAGLTRLQARGQPIPDWALGGGTGLMVHTGHRLSKDIDAFIDDPQYLPILSPRLGGEDIWGCQAYAEAANHLRLIYPQGEIDFIVAGAVTGLPTERRLIDLNEIRAGLSHEIEIEHPVEIALKKLSYRGALLKVRDVFDIAVVGSCFPDLLHDNLHHVSHLRSTVLARLDNISEEYARSELAELDIAEEWHPAARTCLERMQVIAESVPEPKYTP
jgi:hypothetical protein